jgi:hypothetical protein
MIIHPAPLCCFSAPVIFLMPTKFLVKPINQAFSYLSFWIENAIGMLFFIIYEIAMIPIAYGKTIVNIVIGTNKISKRIGYIISWVLIGIPFICVLAIRDLY